MDGYEEGNGGEDTGALSYGCFGKVRDESSVFRVETYWMFGPLVFWHCMRILSFADK